MTFANHDLVARASEVIADIAFSAGYRFAKQQSEITDSRSLMQDITEWACEFEQAFNQDAHGDAYMELVDDYANFRLDGEHDKAKELLRRMGSSAPLTDEQYVSKGGGGCPSCNSTQIEGGSIEVEGSTASQGVRCLDCNANWNDVYALAGYAELETAK